MPKTSSIFIIEDDKLYSDALSSVISLQGDMEVVGSAQNGKEALVALKNLTADIILTDIRMHEMNGIEFIKTYKCSNPNQTIIILTTFNEENYIIEGLGYGANGYLLKDADFEEILQTIRNVINGNYVLMAEVASKLSNYLLTNQHNPSLDTLPKWIEEKCRDREIEILFLLKQRLSNKEIGNQLFVSEGTIKNYLTIIYQKFNVNKRVELIELIKK